MSCALDAELVDLPALLLSQLEEKSSIDHFRFGKPKALKEPNSRSSWSEGAPRTLGSCRPLTLAARYGYNAVCGRDGLVEGVEAPCWQSVVSMNPLSGFWRLPGRWRVA
jgi:hypothetical protein